MQTDEAVWCDVTELFQNPVRTGVQRVAREVLKNWSTAVPLRLCRFDRVVQNLVALPTAALALLTEQEEEVRALSVGQIALALTALTETADPVIVPYGVTLLVPEVFFDEQRCRHHLWREEHAPGRLHLLLFDFIPWLAPQMIGVDRGGGLMWYIRLSQAVRHPAFISAQTGEDWRRRIMRGSQAGGTVLPLGTDGLALRPQTFSTRRRTFVSLGSIDGRKNQVSIVDAFEHLWQAGFDFGLTLVGSVFAQEKALGERLRRLAAAQPRFSFVETATDQDIAEILSQARATIYASKVEGYGLPPVESIAAGIPCLVSRAVPSVTDLTAGVVALEDVTPEDIATAVSAMADDVFAKKVWKETAGAKLPTWRDFGRAVAEWTLSLPS